MSDFDLGFTDDQQPARRELTDAERQFIKEKPTKQAKEKKIRMTVDVPPKIHATMKMLANRHGRPMSQELYDALEAWINRPSNQLQNLEDGVRQ